MKLGAISLAFALVLTAAAHAQQTRFYGPDGKSTGTTFYDARGNVTGRTSTPGARR